MQHPPPASTLDWTDDGRALWARIEAHPFEHSGHQRDFLKRLTCEKGWPEEFARGAIEAYRKFCFLACIGAGEVTPSEEVDEVWHQHLLYSQDYWEVWCAEVLRARLHHKPTQGGPAEQRRFRAQYAATLALHERFFGLPPETYWPAAHTRFRDKPRFRTVDTDRVLVVAHPRAWLRPLRRRIAASVPALCLMLPREATAQIANPLDLPAEPFLMLYGALAIMSLLLAFIIKRAFLQASATTAYAGELDPIAIAYLAGGKARAMNAAIVALLAKGAATFTVKPPALVAWPVLTALGEPLASIHARLQDGHKSLMRDASEMFAPVHDMLLSRGLLVSGDFAFNIGIVSALPPFLVALFGFAKIAVGHARGHPVGILTALVLATLALAIVLCSRGLPRNAAGDRTLAAIRERHALSLRAPAESELALAFALLGAAVLRGTPFAAFGKTFVSSSDGGGGDGGGGDGGGGGGCGGCSS